MILKSKDPLDAEREKLEKCLLGPLSEQDRHRIEKDRAILLAGIQGEKEAAYHMDFHLKDNDNWVVIHDLRLVHKDRTAQIDHLLLNRLLEVFVVESRSYKTKLRYENGGWDRLNQNHWEGVPSPVHQNERHIAVLKDVVDTFHLAPKRLGIPIPLDIFNIVLVHPACSIVGKMPDATRIYRMDAFVQTIREKNPSMLSALKIVSSETLCEFGRKLASFHVSTKGPGSVEASASGMAALPTRAVPVTVRQPKDSSLPSVGCNSCGGPVSKAEAQFCQDNKNRFAGQLLCRKCQSFAPAILTAGTVSTCSECGSEVEQKVVAFCRMNRGRFGGRILCRECQSNSR